MFGENRRQKYIRCKEIMGVSFKLKLCSSAVKVVTYHVKRKAKDKGPHIQKMSNNIIF